MRKSLITLAAICLASSAQAEEYVYDVESYPEHCTGTLDLNDLTHPVCDDEPEKAKTPYDLDRLSNRKPAVACKFGFKVSEAVRLQNRGHGDLLLELGCTTIEKSVEVAVVERDRMNSIAKVVLEIGGQKFLLWVADYQFQDLRRWAVQDACGPWSISEEYAGCSKTVEANFVYKPGR